MSTNTVPTVVYGDTSSFHIGSQINYREFRRLLQGRCTLLAEIRHDFFIPPPIPPAPFISYRAFRLRLRFSRYWNELKRCRRIVVHGEGLTSKAELPTYLCVHFARLARELGAESWLVNFGISHADEFAEAIRMFDYVAARDPVTLRHLQSLGIPATLSFDCCVLATDGIPEFCANPGSIFTMRGKDQRSLLAVMKNIEHVKVNLAWKWTRAGIARGKIADWIGHPDIEAIGLDSIESYIELLSKGRFSVTTSYHANIFSFLSGIPFMSLTANARDRKYRATIEDLLPEKYWNLTIADIFRPDFDELRWRSDVHDHHVAVHSALSARARMNVPS